MTVQNEHDRIDSASLFAVDLASALCARLCHDLSNPLGTLAGTLELAEEDPEQAEEALGLARDAAGELVCRLHLLRAAWAGDCGPMGRGRLHELAAGLPHRVAADVDGLGEAVFAEPVARVLLNLLLLGAEALPRGGTVALSGEPGSGIVVSVSGPSVAWHDSLAPVLLDPVARHPSEPRTVQIPLTARLAHGAGFRLSFVMGGGPEGAPRLLLRPA